ncbi:hypothetical protein GCM10010176_036430 [Nonomuraea spiralis]|nr:hypothetical protein GCM10010176_036430 [Nonomuraea spiralis]
METAGDLHGVGCERRSLGARRANRSVEPLTCSTSVVPSHASPKFLGGDDQAGYGEQAFEQSELPGRRPVWCHGHCGREPVTAGRLLPTPTIMGRLAGDLRVAAARID